MKLSIIRSYTILIATKKKKLHVPEHFKKVAAAEQNAAILPCKSSLLERAVAGKIQEHSRKHVRSRRGEVVE